MDTHLEPNCAVHRSEIGLLPKNPPAWTGASQTAPREANPPDFANTASGDSRAHCGIPREKAPVFLDRKMHAMFLGKRALCFGIFERGCERFLHKQVFTRADTR